MKLYALKRYVRIVKHYFEALVFTKRTPAPYFFKHALLLDFFPQRSTVIETGTYLGETTEIISEHCDTVISIEPFTPLYKYNADRFKQYNNVQIIHAKSEVGFGKAIKGISGTLCLWLDGHYSGAGTHGETASASPIIHELEQVGLWLEEGGERVYVAIDDARLFNGVDGYPDRSEVINFAWRHNLHFLELRDIFFLYSPQWPSTQAVG